MTKLTKITIAVWMVLAIMSFVSSWCLPYLLTFHRIVDFIIGLLNMGIIISSIPAWKEEFKREDK